MANILNIPGGLVDVHVHLREPGFSAKETITTGTRAAAAGGYTTVCAMPNLNPAPDTLEHLQQQLDLIERDAVVRVLPYGTITMGQKGSGELVDFMALAPHVAAFSDDGRGVQTEELMREAMRRVKAIDGLIVAHCEDETLLRGGYIHDGEWCKSHGHKGICSESEWVQVERDLRLVEETGCRYHVCHVSTRESVELIRRAKRKGLPVTAETAPHYLLLTDEDLLDEGRFKMNPPLRSKEDRQALIEGILDGTIEVIATDHAPHTMEEKSRGLAGSAFGIVGLETAFPLLYTYLVKRGVISLEKLLEVMSVNPRRIFRIGAAASAPTVSLSEIPSDAPAPARDWTEIDLDAEYEIDPDKFLSKGRSTPFSGWKVSGKVIKTVVNGKTVYAPPKLPPSAEHPRGANKE